jgi:hypothetical protein
MVDRIGIDLDEWLIVEATSSSSECAWISTLDVRKQRRCSGRVVETVAMNDPIGALGDILSGIIHWFNTVAPGGFGLILIPLGILGVISLLAARRR